MKKLLLFAIACTLGLFGTVSAQETSFNYDFNDGSLAGWRLIDHNGDGYNWGTSNSTTFGGVDGTYGLYSSCYEGGSLSPKNYIMTENKYLITESSVFSFVHIQSDAMYYHENICVVVSDDINDNPIDFDEVWCEEYGQTYVDWQEVNVSLAEYAGQEVYIGLYHYGNGSNANGIKVDNVSLTSSNSGGDTPDAPAAPSAPTNLQTTVEETSVLLRWDAVDGATNYNVYQGESIVANVVYPTQTFTNLNPGTYCYTVTAINDGGESEKSEETCATIQGAGGGDNNGNTVVSIGWDGKIYGEDYKLPFWTYYNFGYSQQIYTANEIGVNAGGEITKIAFKQQNAQKETRNIVVYMQNTTKANFSGGSDWVNETDEHIVFNGSVTTTGTDGTLEIVLPTPFEYTGGNLMISVLDNTGKAAGTVYFYQYITDENRSIQHSQFIFSANNPYKPESMSSLGQSGNLEGVNSSIQITFGESEPEPEVAPSAPTNLSAEAVIGDASIVLTWDETDNATSYNIYNNSNDEFVAEGITETTYTHEGLELDTEYCYYVKAVNAIGISVASNSDCATTFDGSVNKIIGEEVIPDDQDYYDNRWEIPTQTKYKYSCSQQIYTDEVLGIDVACEINKISFFQTTSKTITRNLEIYMQITDKDNFEDITVSGTNNISYDWVNMNDSYKVFDGEYTFVEGECVISLDKKFLYLPGKNILICVVDKTGTASTELLSFSIYQEPDLKYSTLCYYGDDQYKASSLNGEWGKALKRNNQIKLYYQISPAGILATPESLGFFFKSEGWSEKIEGSKNITIIKKNTDISSIVIEGADASFFNISSFDLNDNPIELEIGHGNLTAGQKTANLVITYNEGVKYILLTASIYDPETPDIWELAQEVDLSRGSYTHTPDFTKLHDDYILPKEEPEGNAPDAVYHITLQNEETVEVEVTGANGRYAIYSAADLAGSGPSSSNTYRKISSSFFYDFNDGNLEDFRMVEYDGNNSQWQISEGGGDDNSNALISYSYDGNGATSADNYIITKYPYAITADSKLSFDVVCGGYWNTWDNVMVKISTDGNTFTLIETIDPQSQIWSNVTVDLGSKIDEIGIVYDNYYIALHHQQPSDVYNIKVDNLRLTDGSSGSSESDNVYPAGEYYLVAAAESEFTVNINVKSVPTPIFTGEGNWNESAKWSTGTVPNANNIDVIIDGIATITENVEIRTITINDECSLTIGNGGILTVGGDITHNSAEAFVLGDGGQLFQNNADLQGSFVMNINNPKVWNEWNKTGWQFIASPFTNAAVSQFTDADTYDLYKFDGRHENLTEEWRNHKDDDADFEKEFVSGRGYMASYQNNTTATLSGTFYAGSSIKYPVTYQDIQEGETHWPNFHLLGNPFTFNMDLSKLSMTNMAEGVAMVNNEGGYTYLPNGTSNTIKVGEGFFVKSVAPNPSVSYGIATRGGNDDNTSDNISVRVSNSTSRDNVVLNFAGADKVGFPKLNAMNEDIAYLYVVNNNERYGIFNYDKDVKEVPLSFEAQKMGRYTISVDAEGEYETIVLVDRQTGIETNMLLEDYNFTTTTSKKENTDRFIVRFTFKSDIATESERFAYQSGDELIIEAEGTVQMFDVMGRMVYNSDVKSRGERINVGHLNKAAYILRLVNGEGVKVQKVIIY